ncbi:hypothetical protein D3C73_1070970 [compost metagenome]
MVAQRDDLSIDSRIYCTEGLNAELVKLPVSAGLRPLIAEHRADIIQLAHIRLAVQLILYISAYNPGRSFRTERQIAVAFVLEGVHFAFHDIRGLAHPALEQPGVLEHWRTDLPVIEPAAQVSRFTFNDLPSLYGTR